MAGAIGNILMEGGVAHWELAQGVVTTFATVGLLGGILIGVFLINMASRKGKTQILKDAATLPTESTYGYNKNIAEQDSLGRETTATSSINTITVHLAVILVDCGLAYWLHGLAVKYNVIGLQDIPVWPYALILMYGINTGVMMTGVTLLKICDPKLETPVMADYSLTYAIRQIIELTTTPIMYGILVRGTSVQMLIFGIVYVLGCYIITGIGRVLYRQEKPKQAAA